MKKFRSTSLGVPGPPTLLEVVSPRQDREAARHHLYLLFLSEDTQRLAFLMNVADSRISIMLSLILEVDQSSYSSILGPEICFISLIVALLMPYSFFNVAVSHLPLLFYTLHTYCLNCVEFSFASFH